MKMSHLSLLALAVLSVSALAAQQSKATTTKPSFTNASDSIKFAINDFKSSMNNLFGSKKDTVAFIVSNVEYDDPNIERLKENLKKVKGAKFLGMQFKSSVARLDISYKGKSTDLWDGLPDDTKKAFKIVEADEHNLTLTSRSNASQ